ncbi:MULTISPECIES: phosphate ABC transporter permease subunit PstC [Campylobacter]|uniref:phosphate ABC transporter permease subunit PstC n=1 Tax=Campylobacter TaxID=194 RepID=UPI0023EF6D7E|nr:MULTISPECIES: phosphate ABC transporter permease subunit PstC [Campylobacter]MCI6641370.1 phosphate ABC transporter permease subunit PstC [Campylobacter sp.]MDD7422500.1 phosphate ABC transporter permease subunit PstC [Campylobacter hominis]MDY3117152.1 phosphate ABC transporter permease subunit PstC [Campylobacter hominis]
MQTQSSSAKMREFIFFNLTRGASIFVLVILFAIFAALVYYSLPAISKFGIGFLVSSDWDVVKEQFGGAASIYGSIISTIIAMILATPVAIGIAIFLTEIAPFKIRNFFSINIELLAAIPSIVYGMWGFLYFVPLIQKLFGGTGMGLLTGGIVLSIMILPFIASVTRDSMQTTPEILKESAYALGATQFDVIKDVVFPYSKAGIIGSIILALGRAFGETMAVAFLLGGLPVVPSSITDPATSIPVTLATQFGEAMGNKIYESSLFYLALILFVISFFTIAIAKFVFLRKKRVVR